MFLAIYCDTFKQFDQQNKKVEQFLCEKLFVLYFKISNYFRDCSAYFFEIRGKKKETEKPKNLRKSLKSAELHLKDIEILTIDV